MTTRKPATQGARKRVRQDNGTVSQKTIELHQRQARAVELRTMGWELQAIADELGWRTASAAFRAIESVLRRRENPLADQLRDQQAGRLDLIAAKLWPGMDSVDADVRARTATALVKVVAEKSKLLGLNAPVVIENPLGSSVTVVFDQRMAPNPAVVDADPQSI